MGATDSQIGSRGGRPNNITGWPRDGNHWAWDNGPYLDGNVWADWTAWSALLFLFQIGVLLFSKKGSTIVTVQITYIFCFFS